MTDSLKDKLNGSKLIAEMMIFEDCPGQIPEPTAIYRKKLDSRHVYIKDEVFDEDPLDGAVCIWNKEKGWKNQQK